MSNDLFGEGKEDLTNARANFGKLKDGDNIFRVMPPFKSLKDRGMWNAYHRTHYGYKGNNPDSPDKPRARPFRCPQEKDFKTGMITVECAECSEIERRSAQYEKVVMELKNQGKSVEDITKQTESMAAWLDEHNTSGKYYINALTLDGEFQVIGLPTTAKKEIDALIKTLQKDMGIRFWAMDGGVWINVNRSGKGFNTKYRVDYEKERFNLDGMTGFRPKSAALSQEKVEEAGQKCVDLTGVVRIITPAQISALVSCSGDPDEVDAIFDVSTRRERSGSPRAEAVKETITTTASAVSPTTLPPAPVPSNVAAASKSSGVQSMTDEEFMQMLKGRR